MSPRRPVPPTIARPAYVDQPGPERSGGKEVKDAETIEKIVLARSYARAKAAVESSNASEENTTEWQKTVVFEVVEAMSNGRGNH